MGHAGDELSHRRHLFALQQLFLGLAQIFIGAAGFFVEPDLLDRGGQLAADGDQQVLVVAGVLVAQMVAETHDADWRVFAPEKHPDPGAVSIRTKEVGNAGRQVRHVLGRDDFRARSNYQIAKAIGKRDFRSAYLDRGCVGPRQRGGGRSADRCRRGTRFHSPRQTKSRPDVR